MHRDRGLPALARGRGLEVFQRRRRDVIDEALEILGFPVSANIAQAARDIGTQYFLHLFRGCPSRHSEGRRTHADPYTTGRT